MTDEQIVADIVRREGGYVDDKVDRGRCTNYGITRTTLQEWRGQYVTCDDVRQMPVDEARAIYHARYVKPFDGVDASLKPQVVDIAVNSGVSRARTMLAIAQQGNRPVSVQLVIERLKHYGRICKQDPTQTKFIGGWIERATSFL
jgi:lysozyme family protein